MYKQCDRKDESLFCVSQLTFLQYFENIERGFLLSSSDIVSLAGEYTPVEIIFKILFGAQRNVLSFCPQGNKNVLALWHILANILTAVYERCFLLCAYCYCYGYQ